MYRPESTRTGYKRSRQAIACRRDSLTPLAKNGIGHGMVSSGFAIEGKPIGQGHPCFVVAEIAQTHDGSLGTCHAYIDAAAKAGASAIKFQTHIAAAESTPSETFRVKFSPQDATRYDYWKRMEFTPEQWAGLAQHARDKRLVFLSTPFSFEAVEVLLKTGIAAWKAGSGETNNYPFLKKLAETGKPVLLSSGVSPWSDLDKAVETVRGAGAPVGVYQCTTAYPCPPDSWGLNVIGQIRDRYHCPVGFSDHSGTPHAGLAAAALGANMIEVHVTFSRECFGPDVPASITTSELAQLIEGVRRIETALANPVDKDAMANKLGHLRDLFGKSVVAARDLPRGLRLSREDLALKKPGTGIPAAQLETVIGKELARDVPADTLLSISDFSS
ncbi:MAG: N,N'-diacetyllegionaminic acid synthase [Myxococcota bacterium]|nr:N,N'-diacetyllegionaminic acid synthase [Myxococcota bacterium]